MCSIRSVVVLQDSLVRLTHPPDDGRDDQVIRSIDSKRTQNAASLRALGSICSATTQLPHTTILSDGLKKCGNIAVASGGFTDIWRGSYRAKDVALKAFRTYPIQDLKEAEKVRRTTRVKVGSIFDDPHRYYGRRWSCGRDCLMNTSYHSMVSTPPIFNLRSCMTGRTLAILSSTWIRTLMFLVLVWYRHYC